MSDHSRIPLDPSENLKRVTSIRDAWTHKLAAKKAQLDGLHAKLDEIREELKGELDEEERMRLESKERKHLFDVNRLRKETRQLHQKLRHFQVSTIPFLMAEVKRTQQEE